tara:strand:- start:393 stop:902 length:510 start_codon:yes stop_codon:yes gene_type:complete
MNLRITRIFDSVDRLLKLALILLMSVLVLSITWQVASRYFLRDPSSWTEELARFALIWAGLLGAVYAYRTHAHVGIDILATRLSPVGRRRLEVISAICVIAFSASVIIVGGSNLVALTARLEQTSAALGVQMAWVYAIIPVCGILLVLYALYNIAHPVDDIPTQHEAAE